MTCFTSIASSQNYLHLPSCFSPSSCNLPVVVTSSPPDQSSYQIVLVGGQGQWAYFILTKDNRSPSLCRQYTAAVFYIQNMICRYNPFLPNKLAKARKTRKSPGTSGLKKFRPVELRVKKVWVQNICIDFLAELNNVFFLTGLPPPPD